VKYFFEWQNIMIEAITSAIRIFLADAQTMFADFDVDRCDPNSEAESKNGSQTALPFVSCHFKFAQNLRRFVGG
jgi:hypothetical protein